MEFIPHRKKQTALTNITQNGTVDVTMKETAIVAVPNSYSQSDEGKVVSSGALCSQTSQTITQNGTYDTTLKNEIVVDVASVSYILITTSVTGGYNGGAVITITANDNTIFTATGSSPYNLAYDDTSETVTVDGMKIEITITPPATQTSDLGITIEGENNTLSYSVHYQGSNTSYGYSFSAIGILTQSGGGSGVELMSRTDWDALTTAQKQAKGLVAIQDTLTGYIRGTLVNGADYAVGIIQSGTGASSATFISEAIGTCSLLVIALNSEASTYDLTLSATKNGTAITGNTLKANSYSESGSDRRNYRISVFEETFTAGDEISISLTNRSAYSSFVYAIIDVSFANVLKTLTTCDGVTSGSYAQSCYVIYGTFNSSSGGIINFEAYTAGDTVTTQNPGVNYKSSYIFWLL